MVDFDRIGEVLSSRGNGIVPLRFFYSCKALLKHMRVRESDVSDISIHWRYKVTSSYFALGISIDSTLVFKFLYYVLKRRPLDNGVSFALKHPNASLRHFLDASISTEFRKKYAEPILKGYSEGYYDIPADLFSELVENCSDSIYQSPELLYRFVTNRHFEVATLLLQKTDHTAHTESGLTLIRMLAQDGDVAGMRWCIENGYNIDIVDNNGWTPLSYAVHGGHFGAIKFFLDRNVRTDIVDTAGNSLLHLACMGGSLEVVKFLLTYFVELGVKANEMHCNNDGLNCLHISVKYGYWKLVEWCLENGFDPNQLDSNGLSPLHHAASADSPFSVSALYSGGATYPLSSALESPLLVAVRHRRVDVLHKLIELYHLKSEFRFAFQESVSLGFSENVDVILHHCSLLNELWDKPQHVLSVAISSNNPKVVRMLLRRPVLDICEDHLIQGLGLSLTIEQWEIANDLIGWYKLRGFAWNMLVSLMESTKLSLDSLVDVSVKKFYLWLLELSLDCGLNVDHKPAGGDKTLLICASERGFSGIVEVLLRRGANVNASDRDGRTALIYASLYGDSRFVELLLNHGADVNASDNDGTTSLMHASDKGHSACIEMLLNRGADVSARDMEEETSLMYAAMKGHSSCVKLLLSRGATVNGADVPGLTSLMNVRRFGLPACFDLLMDEWYKYESATS